MLFRTSLSCLAKILGLPQDTCWLESSQCYVSGHEGRPSSISLTSIPAKIMEKIILHVIERHSKNNAIIRHKGFTKVKLHSINLILCYDNITCLVDERKMVDVVFLAFDTIPHSILLDMWAAAAGQLAVLPRVQFWGQFHPTYLSTIWMQEWNAHYQVC